MTVFIKNTRLSFMFFFLNLYITGASLRVLKFTPSSASEFLSIIYQLAVVFLLA